MPTRLKGRVIADNTQLGARASTAGDADSTLQAPEDGNGAVVMYGAPITGDRAVNLSTVNAVEGMTWRVVRDAAATGAFNVNVGTGPLKALATADLWCDVTYIAGVWTLTANGAL